jgi:hypothetical protein
MTNKKKQIKEKLNLYLKRQLKNSTRKLKEEGSISSILSKKGYGPIFNAIRTSYLDLKKEGYNITEIRETLYSVFNIDDPQIRKYINSLM